MLNIGENKEITKKIGFKNDTNDVIFRTGTIGDGSCLIHAFLTAYSPTRYLKDSSNGEKQNISDKVREAIAKKYTIDMYENSFVNLHNFLEFIRNTSINSENAKAIHIINKNYNLKHNIIIELLKKVNISKYLNNIKQYYPNDDNNIKSWIKESIKYTVEIILKENELEENEIKMIIIFLDCILCIKKTYMYELYVKSIKDRRFTLGYEHLKIIIEHFKLNPIILWKQDEKYVRYKGIDYEYDYDYIIIFWAHEVHYENVGCIRGKDNFIRRFSRDDPLIKNIINN